MNYLCVRRYCIFIKYLFREVLKFKKNAVIDKIKHILPAKIGFLK